MYPFDGWVGSMPRDGTRTPNRIMDAAQQMVLDVGLSGTSVEKVIDRAGVTKGTFFYHFKTKHDLAAALIERYASEDEHHFTDAMDKAEQLARDPLQQLLIFVGLFIEMTGQLEEPFPGLSVCLVLLPERRHLAAVDGPGRAHDTLLARTADGKGRRGRRRISAAHTRRLPSGGRSRDDDLRRGLHPVQADEGAQAGRGAAGAVPQLPRVTVHPGK